MIPLIGYTNTLSCRPGETVEVKVSSTLAQPYKADLVRIISGDPNPDGPGMIFEPVVSNFEGDYPSRPQATHLGSHMAAALNGALPDVFMLSATIWPTMPDKAGQGVIALTDAQGNTVAAMDVGPDGAGVGEVRVGTGIECWRWYHLQAEIDGTAGTVRITQSRVDGTETISAEGALSDGLDPGAITGVRVATTDPMDRAAHFNGKIEAPTITANGEIVAAWDFSRNMSSMTVPGAGPLAGAGTLHGAPTRAMTGSNWEGVEMNWTRTPAQWGAIHFHDDDIADCGWETDFEFAVPDDLKSGVYGIRLRGGESWDVMPVFVCPPKGARSADVCFVVSTFTYVIYTNQARADFGQRWRDRAAAWGSFPYNPVDYPDFGLSTYNDHTDGSGIGWTSWHRPILNLRPGYHPFADDICVSGLRHFPADTHILAWLENRGIDFDVVTDWELHHEGADVLKDYKAVLTTSHPEYHTRAPWTPFWGTGTAAGTSFISAATGSIGG